MDFLDLRCEKSINFGGIYWAFDAMQKVRMLHASKSDLNFQRVTFSGELAQQLLRCKCVEDYE